MWTRTLIRFFQPFGQDIFCLNKKFLVFNLVLRNIKTKYRRSFLGLFWTLLAPTAMAMTYYLVFKVIIKVQIPHYLAFIFTGTLPWAYIAQTLTEGMESIVGNWGLLSKIPIPPHVFPMVGALTNLVTLFLALPIMIGTAAFTGVHLGTSLLLVPGLYLGLFLITYSFAYILASFFVYLRDLRHIIAIILQLWFYMTPVIYNESMIPEKYKAVLYINPYGAFFTSFHKIFIYGSWPNQTEVQCILFWLFFSLVTCIGFQKYFGEKLVENI